MTKPQSEQQHQAIYRQKKIIEILKLLHAGGSFEEAKQIFDQAFESVDVSEITSAERELIASGLNPMEIQNLCNVHAAVFKGKINSDTEKTPEEEQPGHPIQVLKLENLIIRSLLNDELLPCLKKWQQNGQNQSYLKRMRQALADLQTINKHYQRKENLIFPLMDKYGITAPPKVMWGVDDQIRELIKTANQLVNQDPLPDPYQLEAAIEAAAKEVSEMIFKEEEIMLPMDREVFTARDWGMVAAESDDIGYTLIAKPLPWRPSQADLEETAAPQTSGLASELNQMAQSLAQQQSIPKKQKQTRIEGKVVDKAKKIDEFKQQMAAQKLATAPEQPGESDQVPTYLQIDAHGYAQIAFNNGHLDLGELTGIFRVLPVDLTFVDRNDQVAWFSDDGERVFPRTKAVIGRAVVNCHPPKSVDCVEKILTDFHAGKRKQAEFWINLHGKAIYIRYFAVYDEDQQYAGCLEVTQDITHIRALTSEKRLEDGANA